MSWRTAKGPHHWKLRHWGAKPSSRRKSRKKKKKKKKDNQKGESPICVGINRKQPHPSSM